MLTESVIFAAMYTFFTIYISSVITIVIFEGIVNRKEFVFTITLFNKFVVTNNTIILLIISFTPILNTYYLISFIKNNLSKQNII